ncbi:MAG: LPP20 family lipoprotein [Planctomycetota bacterium]|jgi:hypothetical protein
MLVRPVSGVLLVVLLLLPSCGSSPGPAPNGSPSGNGGREAPPPGDDGLPYWVANHKDPQFPDSRFLVGISSADIAGDLDKARSLAVEQAESEISRKIRTRLRSVVESYVKTVVRGEAVFNHEELSEKIESTTDIELSGADLKRSWTNKKTGKVWVLVVVDRPTYAKFLLSQVRSQVALIKPVGETKGAPGARLPRLLLDYQGVTECLGKLANVEVVIRGVPREKKELLTFARGKMDEIDEIVRSIKVRVVEGGEQKPLPTGIPPDKVVVQVTAGREPLEGFPIGFALERVTGGKVVPKSQRIGPDGRAAGQVTSVELGRSRDYTVVARLDFAKFAPDFPATLVPEAGATFFLPVLEKSRFAVAFAERNGDSTGSEIVLGKIL